MSSSTQGHNLNNFGSTRIDNATTKFQSHQSIGSGEEDFLRFFTINGHGGHVGHVTRLICINVHSHSPSRFHMNIRFKSPNCF